MAGTLDIFVDGGGATTETPSVSGVAQPLRFAELVALLGYTPLNASSSQSANTVLAAPNGSNGAPTFRALVPADIPALTLDNLPGAWVKKAVDAATTAALTLNTAQTTIDGVTITATTRVLVKDQATASQNGIYTNVNTTTWTRTADADTSGELAGATVSVDAGTVNFGKIFTTNFKPTDTLGTTAMVWYQIIDSSLASSTSPNMDGTATVGTSLTYARADHIHPTDTSRAPAAGSTSITTLGTIATGTWNATAIGTTKGGTGLTALGTANQVLGVNSGATAYEFKTLTAGTNITITHTAGVVTIAAASGGGTTTNAITFNNSNTGAASGTTFNGSAAVTVSANTLGALPLAGGTLTGTLTGKTAGADTAAGFSSPSTAGAYATMYTRRGAPFASSYSSTGSTYAPITAIEYSHNAGWTGVYSTGVENLNAANQGAYTIHHIDSGGTNSRVWYFYGTTGDFTSPGNVTAYSDERIKNNWRDLPENFLEKMADVKHGIYDRIDSGATQAGVSAQSLREVLPQTVTEDFAGMLSVAYGNAALVTCIQLARELTALKKLLSEKGMI